MTTTVTGLPADDPSGIELWVDLYGPITPVERTTISEYHQQASSISDTLDHAVYGSPADEYRRIAGEDGPGRARQHLIRDLTLCDEWSMRLSDLLGALGDGGHRLTSRAAIEYHHADRKRLDQIHEAIRTGALEWLLDVTAARG